MRLNHIREVSRLPLSQRINRLLKRDPHQDRRNFLKYLDKESRKGSKKEFLSKKRKNSFKREGKDNKNFPEDKGRFIDVRV